MVATGGILATAGQGILRFLGVIGAMENSDLFSLAAVIINQRELDASLIAGDCRQSLLGVARLAPAAVRLAGGEALSLSYVLCLF